MRKSLLISFLFAVLCSSCKKVIDTQLDKQITLYFPLSYWSTNNTDFATLPVYSFLTDFDKRDYVNIDSVTFVAALSLDDPTDTVYARIFDVTDNKEIENSEIFTTNISINNYNIIQTQNIVNSLPDKRITLSVQFKSAKGKSYVYLEHPFLKLRRD